MKVLTVKETADLLKVKPQWVYKMRRGGGLPFVRLGRQIRVDEDSLEKWLAETVLWRDVDSKDAGGRAIDSPNLKANLWAVSLKMKGPFGPEPRFVRGAIVQMETRNIDAKHREE